MITSMTSTTFFAFAIRTQLSRQPWFIVSILLFTTLIALPIHAASFYGLGYLPGADVGSLAMDVSADGLTILGSCATAETTNTGVVEYFVWTMEQGKVPTSELFTLPTRYEITRLSPDGSSLIGRSEFGFVWSQENGLEKLPTLSETDERSLPFAASVKANTIVGTSPTTNGKAAVYWDENRDVHVIDGSIGGSGPIGVSADGVAVVGVALVPQGREAFRWTQAGGLQLLGDLLGGQHESQATAISHDGSTVVGTTSSAQTPPGRSTEPFRWTTDAGMTSLGFPQGRLSASPNDVSGDGSLVVGTSYRGVNGDSALKAFVWNEEGGSQDLKYWLSTDHRLSNALLGWELSEANAVSADGKVIVGYGINPAGKYEGWVAVVPEPGALSTLTIALTFAAVVLIVRGRATSRHAITIQRN